MKQLALSFFLLLTVQSVIAQGDGLKDVLNLWPEITEESKPWTRWWWMGNAVNEVELRRLLNEYAAKGFGGVEITPIYGVKGEEKQYIDFLSPEWMKMLSITIEMAHQNGMGVDMNTGTGWPFGGPHISSEYAAKSFQLYTFKNTPRDSVQSFIRQIDLLNEESLIALSGISETGERINLLQQQGSLDGLGAGIWDIYAATQRNTNQKVKRAAPGGEGLVFNHFSKDATGHYLDQQGISWKTFHDINFVNLDYQPFDASGWDVLPSGINGKVELIHMKSTNHP